MKPAKAMEEQILEILKKRMIYPDLQDRLKMTLTLMSEDITSHIMEFIKWKDTNKEYKWRYIDHPNDDWYSVAYREEMNIEEHYQFWLNNVKHA